MQLPKPTRGQVAITAVVVFIIAAAYTVIASTGGTTTLMAYIPFGHSTPSSSSQPSTGGSGASTTGPIAGLGIGNGGTTTDSMTGAGIAITKPGPVDGGVAEIVKNSLLVTRLTNACADSVSAVLAPLVKRDMNQQVNLAATPGTGTTNLVPKCLFLTTNGTRIVVGSFTIKDPTKALAAGDAWSTWVTSVAPGGKGDCQPSVAPVTDALGKNPWQMPDGGEFFQTHVSNCIAGNGDSLIVITRGLTVGFIEGPASQALSPGDYAQALVAAIPAIAS